MANNNNQQAANTPTIEQLQKQLAEANEKAAAAQKRADTAEKESAQAKAQLEAMANKPDEEAPVEEVPEKRVKIFIERGSAHDEPNLLVSVNGVNYLLPRGEESEVPESVAYEIKRARKALNRYDKTRESLLGK